jgi:hypothetical protein
LFVEVYKVFRLQALMAKVLAAMLVLVKVRKLLASVPLLLDHLVAC